MIRKTGKGIAGALILALTLSMVPVPQEAQAAKIKISSVKVTNSRKKLVLTTGKSYKLKVKVKASPNKAKYKKVKFTSSNKKVATVSKVGKISAKKVGTAKITVASTKNKKKKTVIKVTVKKKTAVTTPQPTADTSQPTNQPMATASAQPTAKPTVKPTEGPTIVPSATPIPTPDGTTNLSRMAVSETAVVNEALSDVSIIPGEMVNSIGEVIEGTYTWADADVVLSKPGVSYQKAIFTPSDSEYETVQDASVRVVTEKQRVILTPPSASTIKTSDALSSSTLSGGSAVDTAGNQVKGTFTWTKETAVPGMNGANQVNVTFTPEDKATYYVTTCYTTVEATGDSIYKIADDIDLNVEAMMNETGYTAAWGGSSYDISSYIKEIDMSQYGTAAISFKAYDANKKVISSPFVSCKLATKANDWTGFASAWGSTDATISLDSFTGDSLFVVVQNVNADTAYIKITDIVLYPKAVDNIHDGSSFLSAFSPYFPKLGVAFSKGELTDSNMMKFGKSQFNSVTMGNEMKPDYVLGGKPNLQENLPDDYIDTNDFTYEYKDTVYPKLDMTSIDNYIKIAYKNGMKIRYHVFIWHKQTPQWFFKENFSTDASSAYVTPEVMNGRIEYLVRNVMTHIYNLQNTDGVYIGREVIDSWDVANEYFHNNDGDSKSYWDEVYYPDYVFSSSKHSGILTPVYIKEAFVLAHSILKDFKLVDSVNLLLNDYNTYQQANNIVTAINYFNTKDDINVSGERVCDGVGMQSHLAINYPSVEAIRTDAVEIFREAGFEIEITEADVTDYQRLDSTQKKQEQYWYDFMKMLVDEKNKGANITGVTWWGPCDTRSWRSAGVPLLFREPWFAKKAYFNAIGAVSDYNQNIVAEQAQ